MDDDSVFDNSSVSGDASVSVPVGTGPNFQSNGDDSVSPNDNTSIAQSIGGGIFGGSSNPFGSLNVANIASTLTSAVSQFLPLIFIGIVIYMFFNIAKKHGR